MDCFEDYIEFLTKTKKCYYRKAKNSLFCKEYYMSIYNMLDSKLLEVYALYEDYIATKKHTNDLFCEICSLLEERNNNETL